MIEILMIYYIAFYDQNFMYNDKLIIFSYSFSVLHFYLHRPFTFLNCMGFKVNEDLQCILEGTHEVELLLPFMNKVSSYGMPLFECKQYGLFSTVCLQ